MNFEAKIGEITDSVKSQVSHKKVFIGRVIEIEQIVMTGLNSFKFKKFSITEIKEKDIHQTLCKIMSRQKET